MNPQVPLTNASLDQRHLNIQPVAKNKLFVTELDTVNENLPQPPFAMGLVAPKGSGKSTIIYNLVSRPEFYYKKFDQVWMLSPTFYLDDTYAKLKLNEERVVTDVAKFADTMTQIIDKVNNQIEAIKRSVSMAAQNQGWSKERAKEEVDRLKHQQCDRILIIIDDAVGVKAMERGSVITNSFSRHRHLFISFLYAIQIYKAMPPVVRVNLSALIIFRMYNKGELKKIVEEQAVMVKDATWLALYEHATAEPFSFFYINYKHPKYRFFKNFTTPLVVDRE
jgi:hypothetical protein